ncbi:MAG TPA: FAD-dependent oxidoreductase, partial [Gemmatimonadota bacterium]|nr:FAD-dependent oxidoreductase [Gemmatimonadota bacterium]
MSGRVVVVGGGIAGASVALSLRRRGNDVVVLDGRATRDGPPGPEATGASAGMLAPCYEASGEGPLFRLGVAARRRHPGFVRRLESLAGTDLGLREEGMLVPAFTAQEEAAAADAAARQREMGLEAHILPGREACALQPGLTPVARGWTWLPGEGSLDTQRLAAALRPALEAAGA